MEMNRLVLVGNGFDLAHGLKTSYKNFLDWYMCDAFGIFYKEKSYKDSLLEIKSEYSNQFSIFETTPNTIAEVINLLSSNKNQSIDYHSNLLNKLITSFEANNWIDIERYYFKMLKAYFSNPNINNKQEVVNKLNKDFDFLISKLADYIDIVNESLTDIVQLKIGNSNYNAFKVFKRSDRNQVKFLNFNYTETLSAKGYADEENIIHIHGRASDIENNPIIFGYGDESDPIYQQIEDSGENAYLEHIKSFGYFRTGNYHKLLSYIDSAPYTAYIIGHSCGLSDRVLLNEIFEHKNCERIEVFYHIRSDGSDNFKEITQEISRHFRPHNKDIMRRRVGNKNARNIIPQN